MRGAVLLALALASIGCGGVSARPATARTSDRAVPEHVGGRALLVVQRPLDGHVAISVWFDAGSLDGPNASVALVAADVAASGLDGVTWHVAPDGTAFRRLCPIASLSSCAGELARRLATFDVSEADLAGAIERVSTRRARGLGSARREAETLAVGAALGIELTPLGDAEDVVTREGVARYVDDHYGTERSLWIAIGETDTRGLAPILAEMPQRRAARSRGERQGREDAATSRAAEGHAGTVWALARRVEDGDAARALASAWWARRGLANELAASAFPTRAGWVALVSFAGDDDDGIDVARWRDVLPAASARQTAHDDVWAIADRAGTEWTVGAVPRVGARDALALVGPDADRRLEASAAGARRGAPWREATRIAVPGSDAIAIAWLLPGPIDDGAAARGASNIAAEILARRCVARELIDVGADGVIVHDVGPETVVLASASTWADCVALTTPTATEIDAARRTLIAQTDAQREREAIAAQLIVPAQPGAISPRPSLRELSDVPASDVLERWMSWRDGGRWGLAGAVDAASGRATTPPISIDRAEAPERIATSLDAMERLLTFAQAECGSAAHGAAIRAALSREALSASVSLVWSSGGASRGLAWGAASATGSPDALAAWETRVRALVIDPTAARSSDTASIAALGDLRVLAARAAIGETAGGACTSAPQVQATWLDPPIASRRR